MKSWKRQSLGENMVIKLPEKFTGSFSFVDCGAAGDTSNPLLQIFERSRFIGFDPELSQPLTRDERLTYFPVAVGRKSEVRQFYRTQNRNCSSVFIPNQEFLDRFVEVDEFFKITETFPIKLITLDEYLPEQKIDNIDFIELDTQGSEIYILQGAERLVLQGVIAIRVEVEFAEMYQQQPMFADVDTWLRRHGFMLFDLERYHLRRKFSPSGVDSREQIVWGQALYLREYRSLSIDTSLKQKLGKLAMVASYYGFHGYALETVNYLTQQAELLTSMEKQELDAITTQYISELNKESRRLLTEPLGHSFFGKVFRKARSLFKSSRRRLQTSTHQPTYFWKD